MKNSGIKIFVPSENLEFSERPKNKCWWHIVFLVLLICIGSFGFVSAVGNSPCLNPTLDMVACYMFNNDSTKGENYSNSNGDKIADYSNFGNNGTLVNGTFNVTGGYLGDGAFEFNGSSDSIQLGSGNMEMPNISFTFSTWIKLNELGKYQKILNKDAGGKRSIDWQISNVNKLDFSIFNQSGSSVNVLTTKTLSVNIWYNIVAVYNGTNLLVYLDGDLSQVSSVLNGPFAYNTSIPVLIGKAGAGTAYYLNGSIDEAIIYNRSLSDLEIFNNYIGYKESCGYNWTFINKNNLLINGSNSFNLSCIYNSLSNVFMSFDNTNYTLNPSITINNSLINLTFFNENLRLFSINNESGNLFSDNIGIVNITNSKIFSWNGTGYNKTYGSTFVDDKSRIYFRQTINKYSPVFFINSSFFYLDAVAFSYANNSIIKNNKFLNCTSGLGVTISHNNLIEYNVFDGLHTGFTAPDYQNLTLGLNLLSSQNNLIQYNNFSNIYSLFVPEISAGIHCQDSCFNSLIRYNSFENSEVGVFFYYTNRNVTLDSNNFQNISASAIKIEGNSISPISDILLKNNVIKDIAKYGNTAGIHFSGTNISNITLLNNSIDGFYRTGIILIGNKVEVTNNSIKNTNSSGIYGVSFNNLNDSIFSSNQIINFTNGYRIGLSDNVTIENQEFINNLINSTYNFEFYQSSSNIKLINISYINITNGYYFFVSNITNLTIQTPNISYIIPFLNSFYINSGNQDVHYSNYSYPFLAFNDKFNYMFNNTMSNRTLNILVTDDLNNFLAFNGNYSLISNCSSNINSNDGQINISLPTGNSSYILDNYNITEGYARDNDPLFNGTYLNNTLTDTITVSNYVTEYKDGIIRSGSIISNNQILTLSKNSKGTAI